MLNHGMPLIHFLDGDGHRSGRSLRFVAIHCCATAVECLRSSASPGIPRRIAHGHGADLSMSGRGHAFDGNASIDNRGVVNGIVVDDGGLVINVPDFGVAQTAMAQIAIIKVAQGDEGKVVRAQSEIEIHAHADAIEAPAQSGIEDGVRGQWRPTAIITCGAPGNPSRTPNPVRSPDPPTAVVHLPTAIMEGGPTPGIIRLPEPSAIRVNPVAAIAIGTPATIDRDRAWLPAPADAVQFHPGSVRREIVVKIVHVDGRGADINRRRSHDSLRRHFRLRSRRLGGWRERLCLSAERIVMS